MYEDSPSPDSADEAGDASSTNLQHVLIKWTGSKRRLAKQIVAMFPCRISTYYEPFLGGGSVLYELLGTDIEVGRFECSDICEPLIALWNVVKDDPLPRRKVTSFTLTRPTRSGNCKQGVTSHRRAESHLTLPRTAFRASGFLACSILAVP
jgi:site-specific DNA-adenine methylase